MMSDESDLEMECSSENSIYRRKYQLLQNRCEQILIDNENLLKRIYKVSRLYKRRKAECKYVMNRLDDFGDDWRNAPPVDTHDHESAEKVKVEEQSKPVKRRKKMKQERTREKDPNAPKRPPNAFFQFCQEQRQHVLEACNASLKAGEPELTKQELTKQLALRWKSMTADDKKVYVDMYERSKEKYTLELNAYNKG